MHKIAYVFLCAILFINQAFAAHSVYNPMMPRQLSEVSAQADYTYGYSILSGHAIDSLDEANRMMWYVNYDLLDHYFLRPIAHTYAALPQGVRDSVGNFFNNLDEINYIPNNLLVGRPQDSFTSTGRLFINSTIGVLGFFDVASTMGISAKPMTFNTVLGKAGVEQGSFIMVPFYGPTTARSLNADMVDGAIWYSMSWPLTIVKWSISGIHSRSLLISQESVIDNALDPYITTRDVYLMYEEGKVNPLNDGEVKGEDEFDDALLDEIDNL